MKEKRKKGGKKGKSQSDLQNSVRVFSQNVASYVWRNGLNFALLRKGSCNFDIGLQMGVDRDSSVVFRLAMSWTVRGSNPSGSEIFPTRPDRPWGPPSLLHKGYRVFVGGKAAVAWL